MIRYFLKGLKPSVRAQLDAQAHNLNFWVEAVEKGVNAEVKAMLQSSSSIRDIDSKCSRGNKPAKKEEKDSDRKNKSTDSPSTDTSNGKQSFSIQQTSFANPKKDQDHQQGGLRRQGGQQRQRYSNNSPATGDNASAVRKKVKNVSQIKYYNYHRKGYYTTKYLQGPKN